MINTTIPTRLISLHINPTSSNPIVEIPVNYPFTYEFRVVEFVNVEGKVVKSRLQIQRNIHDEYGNISYSEGWADIPRIQLPI